MPSPYATPGASRRRTRDVRSKERQTRLRDADSRPPTGVTSPRAMGGNPLATTAAAAGRTTGRVGRRAVGTAVPAGVPPSRALGRAPSTPSTAAAGGQGDWEKDHYEKLRRQLQDFFDGEKVSQREPNDAEKDQLKNMTHRINRKLSTEEVEASVNTAQTLGAWKEALRAARRDGNFTVAKAVEEFAMFRFGIRQLPPAGAERTEKENLIVDFLRKSLFRGTLAGHIERRLQHEDFVKAAKSFPYPILCSDHYIRIFATAHAILAEESDAGGKVSREIRESIRLKGEGRTEILPLVIGGESGIGKTTFAALAPKFMPASPKKDAGDNNSKKAEAVKNQKKDDKSNNIVVYATAGQAESISPRAVAAIKAADAALQAAARTGEGDVTQLRRARTKAAAAYLKDLVELAIGGSFDLQLPDDEKYSNMFVIVDELSSSPQFFRALLVENEGQQSLLECTKGVANAARLICCGTGSRAFILSCGTSTSNYLPLMMEPSETLFGRLLLKAKVDSTVVAGLLSNANLRVAVGNRRVAILGVEKVLDDLGAAASRDGQEQLRALTKVRRGVSGDIRGYAGSVMHHAAREYCVRNGLRFYSGGAAAAVMLEGLGRLLSWKAESNVDAEGLFDTMLHCSPLTLGTFTLDKEDTKDSSGSVTGTKFTYSVSAAQLMMTAVSYGAPLSAMADSPGGFEELSAFLFTVFLGAVRTVEPWTDVEEARKEVLDKNKEATDGKALIEFTRALRGPEPFAAVSLSDLLAQLDPLWARKMQTLPAPSGAAAGSYTDPRAVVLKHSRVGLDRSLHKIELPSGDGGFKQKWAAIRDAMERAAPDAAGGSTAFVIINADRASSYADFFVVSGEFLLLVQCERTQHEFDKQDAVKEELRKMGFEIEADKIEADEVEADANERATAGASGDAGQKNPKQDFTKKLMEEFKCRVAVPVFCVSTAVRLTSEGRNVVAVGHGWRGPAPFVHITSSVTKSCERPATVAREAGGNTAINAAATP